MLKISVKSDVKAVTRGLDDFARRQVPFAQARAVTEVAKRVQKAETAALSQVLDSPTPFTKRAFAVQAATKANPTAKVSAREIQARYLAPNEFGTAQNVAKVALLRPVDIPLNQYGNISRALRDRIKAGGEYLIARLTFRNGQVVSGIWRRYFIMRPGKKRTRVRVHHVELLVRFAAPKTLNAKLGFEARAEKLVRAEIRPELVRQLEAALATAR